MSGGGVCFLTLLISSHVPWQLGVEIICHRLIGGRLLNE
jgi:hypothetical protein